MTQADFGPRNDCPVGIWSIYFITLFSSSSLLSTCYICGIVVGIQMVEQPNNTFACEERIHPLFAPLFVRLFSDLPSYCVFMHYYLSHIC